MNTKYRSLRYNLAYWIILIILVILSVFGIFQYRRANAAELRADNAYSRAFYDLADSVREIDSSLEKIMLAQNPTQISALASDIYAQAEAAKACLSQLPLENGALLSASKFLSQAGDYTAYISAKVTDSGEVTEEEFNNLLELAKHAEAVDTSINELLNNLNSGKISFKKEKSTAVHAADDAATDFHSGLDKIEKGFVNYPSLIYDGPFSEHIEKLEPEAIKLLSSVTESEAKDILCMYLGNERGANLTQSGESQANPESYVFSHDADGRQISARITKKGGMPVWFLDNREIGSESISIDEAKNIGAKYLRQMGYTSMLESYYEKNGNTVTINYAYVQNDVVMYSDLIKLKIALDNGEVIGFEGHGYIMSHKLREIPENIISVKEAQEHISKHLDIRSVRLAMIPKDSMREVLCYEFSGRFNDKNFLIYINAETGKDEKILMLIETENGVLTV